MRRLTLLLASAALIATTACKGGDTDTDTDTDGGDDAGCESTDGVSPSIVSATWECTIEDVSDPPVETILIEAQVNDPQGDFTLATFGDHKLRIYLAANDSLTQETDTLFCDANNAGSCGGSVNATQVGLSCSTADNYYFTVQFADDEGNLTPECRLKEKD